MRHSKNGKGAALIADSKFVLRLKRLMTDKYATVFKVAITEAGGVVVDCTNMNFGSEVTVCKDPDCFMECKAAPNYYRFDLHSNCFSKANMGGYIGEGIGDPPRVSGGICTKID
jgi:hypothetical protein